MPDEKKPAKDEAVEEAPEWEGSLSAPKPLVAPDGHVTLSHDDIKARD